MRVQWPYGKLLVSAVIFDGPFTFQGCVQTILKTHLEVSLVWCSLVTLCFPQSDNTRMLYTSPLKALSNQVQTLVSADDLHKRFSYQFFSPQVCKRVSCADQKYRELQEQFHDVGLLTGDSSINPGASCLVVTTEVLRCMLYGMDDIVREIDCVVFDEV